MPLPVGPDGDEVAGVDAAGCPDHLVLGERREPPPVKLREHEHTAQPLDEACVAVRVEIVVDNVLQPQVALTCLRQQQRALEVAPRDEDIHGRSRRIRQACCSTVGGPSCSRVGRREDLIPRTPHNTPVGLLHVLYRRVAEDGHRPATRCQLTRSEDDRLLRTAQPATAQC
eukprot:3891719-Prymnesium_polylepis.3